MKKLPRYFYDKFGILKTPYLVALSLINSPIIKTRFLYPQGKDEILFSYQHEIYELLTHLGYKIEFSWESYVPLDESDKIIISNRAFRSIIKNWRKIMFKNE